MVDSIILEVLVNLLQFFATLMVASEYYLSKKQLISINKCYEKLFKKEEKVSNKYVDKLRTEHKKEWKKNSIGLVISFLLLLVFPFIFLKYIMFIKVSSVAILFSVLLFVISLLGITWLLVKYYIGLLNYHVENFWYKLFQKIGRLIFLARKNPIVGLGVILFSFSFLCNIWIALKWNESILMIILIFLFLPIFMHINFFIEANKARKTGKHSC